MLVYELNGMLRLCVDGKARPALKPDRQIIPKKKRHKWKRIKG